MAISARIPVGLDTNKFIPELFSKNVLVAIKHNLIVVPQVNHSYESELAKGDTLYITGTNTVEASEVTIGTEGVIKNPLNTAALTLTIDKYYEAPVVVDYMSRRQSHIDLVGIAVTESAFALSTVMDTSLCDLFSAISGTAGTDGSAITDDVLIAAVETMDEADTPAENRAWILDPSSKADFLKIDKFVRSDYFASDAIPTGGFRKDIYGAPLLITTNLTDAGTGNYGAYLHRDCLAIVVSENMTVDRVDQPLKHQLTINTTCLWGVKEIRDSYGVHIHTRLHV